MGKWKAWIQLTKTEATAKAKDLRTKGYKVKMLKASPGNYMLYYGK